MCSATCDAVSRHHACPPRDSCCSRNPRRSAGTARGGNGATGTSDRTGNRAAIRGQPADPRRSRFARGHNLARRRRLELTLGNLRISAAANRLTVTGNLARDARARVRVAGTGIDQSVECRTSPPVRERGTATFDLGTGSGSRYPFTLRFTTPDNLLASLDCDIAELRRIENVLPVNSLAGQLANGTIDIGLAPALELPTPGAGRPLVVPLNPRRPTL